MGATGALIALTAISAASSGISAYSQSKAIKEQGEYEASIYETNARLSEMQAEDAIRRGNQAGSEKQRQTKKLIGKQRAAMAAQGLDLAMSDSDALLIQEETAEMGALDVWEIKNNAWREAWGYKVMANDYLGKARFTKMTAKNKARNTLLTGGLSIAKDIAAGAYMYGSMNPSGNPQTISTSSGTGYRKDINNKYIY